MSRSSPASDTPRRLDDYPRDGPVAVLQRRNGDPWWIAADVCRVLDIANGRDAVARLDYDEKAAVVITDTSSNGVEQRREVTIINESGLYSLIMTSRKPEAKAFKKWVTSVVLPSIRKNGGYLNGQETNTDAEILAAALRVADRVIADRTARALQAEARVAFKEIIRRGQSTKRRVTARSRLHGLRLRPQLFRRRMRPAWLRHTSARLGSDIRPCEYSTRPPCRQGSGSGPCLGSDRGSEPSQESVKRTRRRRQVAG